MTLKKSSWKELIEILSIGAEYKGAVWNESLDDVVEAIEELPETNWKPNRMYKSGKVVLKLHLPDGSASFIDKIGKVYSYKEYMLVRREFKDEQIGNSTCTVIYRRNPNKL